MNRKSVHINLIESVHSEFRIIAFKNKLSMQEIISGMVTALVDNDDYLVSLIEKMKLDKKNNQIKKITNIESTDIFDAIKDNSPWKKHN